MAKARRPYEGVYATIDFPPYEYQEFPKYIATGMHGKFEIAYTQEEELEIRTRNQLQSNVISAGRQFSQTDPERELLAGRAAELGVPINRKWSIAKLKQVIMDAEKSIDDLPADEGLQATPQINVDDLPPDENEHVKQEVPPALVVDQARLKDDLIAKARSMGINANKLWGIPRLKATIAEAEQRK